MHPSEFKLKKSMEPKSANLYIPCLVRETSAETIKFQGPHMEISAECSSKLTEFIKALPHKHASMAGTGVMYAEAQMSLHDPSGEVTHPVRVQIAGPALNRDWGAEFVLDHPQLRSYVEKVTKMLQDSGKVEGQPEPKPKTQTKALFFSEPEGPVQTEVKPEPEPDDTEEDDEEDK